MGNENFFMGKDKSQNSFAGCYAMLLFSHILIMRTLTENTSNAKYMQKRLPKYKQNTYLQRNLD